MTTRGNATVQFTKKELMTLANALNEVINGPDAIEGWEFSTRMGVEASEAEQLLVKINALLTSINDAASEG
jgi:hypothetical protein